MNIQRGWLVLAAVGVALPYAAFLPWLRRHGLDVPLFAQEMFANGIASFFALDVLVSAAVVLALVASERRRLGRAWWVPLAGLAVVGVSLALPLTLYLRARAPRPADQ